MAFVNGCDAESSSPYCVCTDYYGNVLPEYRKFDTTSQTFSCCNEIKEFSPPSSTTGTNWILTYARSLSQNTPCSALLEDITTDAAFAQELPLLYYQAYFNGSLFSKFSSPSSIDTQTVSCTSGNIPYVVKYPNYSNGNLDYKILCGSVTTSGLEGITYVGTDEVLDYSLSHILKDHGEPCLSNQCVTKYSILANNEYNIGDTFYKSPGNISGDSVLLKSWFWVILLVVSVMLGFGIYYAYYHGMNDHFERSVNYLNNVKKGLGDTAKKHSKKNQKAHFHMNT